MIIKVSALAIGLMCFSLSACDQSDKPHESKQTAQTYSLCPKDKDARQKLGALAKVFARQDDVQFVDRSAAAQQELSRMDTGSQALHSTGGELLVMTLQKEGRFRISISNLGLREKVAIKIRRWDGAIGATEIDDFLRELSIYWVIEPVAAGVTDAPPC